jgi:hypothetical protein
MSKNRPHLVPHIKLTFHNNTTILHGATYAVSQPSLNTLEIRDVEKPASASSRQQVAHGRTQGCVLTAILPGRWKLETRSVKLSLCLTD